MKKIFYSLLSFGLMIMLFSACETQEDIVKESGKKISTETVSFKTLLSKVQNKKMEANQRIWFEQKNKGNFYRTDEDFIKDIDTTTVEKMVVDGKESYTLRILTQDDTENRFYNMVVSEKEDAFYTSYIKYEGIDNTKEGVEKVMNSVKTSVDENGEEFSENNPSSGNRDDCINIIPTWLCDQGCFHSPEDSGTVCPAGTSWQIIGYTIETVPCSGTNPGYTPNHTSTNPSPTESNNNYPTSSQPHGGSSGSYYGNPVYTIPVLPKKTAKEIKLAFLAFLNDTNNPHPNELAWWNTLTNKPIVDEIVAYLTDNQAIFVEEQTPFDFALEIINASITLDMNAMSVWDDYDNFVNQMSTSEKAIFENILANRKLMYMCSAKKAFDKAAQLFPTSIYNGKGDAFRHALWNGYCALTMAGNLGEQLTTAHESKPSKYPFNYKETQMDLYNNNKGREIAQISNLNNIATNILQDLNNGYLRYLNNLSTNPSTPNQATYNSVLIPTDQ